MESTKTNQFIANTKVAKGDFMSFFKQVQNGEIVPVYDEFDNIVGFNHLSGSTGLRHSKLVQGCLVVGNTVEELNHDEQQLRLDLETYKNCPIQQWFEFAWNLVQAKINVDKVIKNNQVAIDLTNKKAYNTQGKVIADFSNVEASPEVIEQLIELKLK